MELHLKKFTLDMIPDDANICLIGKRRTGKSTVVKDLLYHKMHIPVGTVISGTESANKYFGHFVPKPFIHYRYSPFIVENAVKRQKLVMKKVNREKSMYGYTNIDPRAFLVLDDCLYDDSWVREHAIREIFMNGRHWNVLFIVTMQFPLGITPNLRTNVDFTFIMRENLISNRKRIWENYAGMFPTFDMFCQVMNQCTENFECLVIRNNCDSNRIEDQVFWFKAEQRGEFRMGSPEYWAMSRPDDDDDDDTDEQLQALATVNSSASISNAFRTTRKGPSIQVKKRV